MDGDTIHLTSQDIVISDGHKPLSLAGIMGGKQSGITFTTQQIILEAGCLMPLRYV